MQHIIQQGRQEVPASRSWPRHILRARGHLRQNSCDRTSGVESVAPKHLAAQSSFLNFLYRSAAHRAAPTCSGTPPTEVTLHLHGNRKQKIQAHSTSESDSRIATMQCVEPSLDIRAYQATVRVGNWNEDIALEEERLKDFLEKREQGKLLIQKSSDLKSNVLKKSHLSAPTDGFLHFGDAVMLVNPDVQEVSLDNPSPVCDSVSLALTPDDSTAYTSHCLGSHCGMSANRNLNPCARNTFVITSVDGSPQGDILRYGQNFALRTKECFTGQLYLASDLKTFVKCARKSRLQEVSLTAQPSYVTCWQAAYLDPQLRMEYEGLPVPANTKLLIIHSKTNQCLAVLRHFILWTYFGKEYEVTAQTYLDGHKAEEKLNHWIIVTGDPGDDAQSMFTRPEVPFGKNTPEEKKVSFLQEA
ncbi:cilia- and flagella-associated protein 161 [Ambystoma mexicanum]|uniref:cilia- and flagella-associated protein 161 n=1 Tax=Ambystoma mexicanum TaxID=8296 RepID=UPI0037E7735F